MNLPQIIVLLTTLLAIAFICRLYGKLAKERAKRIETMKKLIEERDQSTEEIKTANAERDEWKAGAESLQGWLRIALDRGAESKREITTLHCQLDSMTSGDRRCVAGHRYYTGQGISCPQCGAAEVKQQLPWPVLIAMGHAFVRKIPAYASGVDSAEVGIDVRSFRGQGAEWKVCTGCTRPMPASEALRKHIGSDEYYCKACVESAAIMRVPL